MPCWTEILQAEEECDGCTRPVGPGLAAMSNELGKRRSAVCPRCLAGIHPKLGLDTMGLLPAVSRYTRLLAILYNLTYPVAIHARPA